MRLIILGAGGFGRTVADIAEQTGEYSEILFLDDNSSADDIAGKCTDFHIFSDGNTMFYPAFGNNAYRLEWYKTLIDARCDIPSIVHKTAYISPTSQILPGTVIMPHAVVNTGCVVKEGCIINCSAIVDHGCVLERCAHVCLGAIIKAENHIPECMKIEAGEIVLNRTYLL